LGLRKLNLKVKQRNNYFEDQNNPAIIKKLANALEASKNGILVFCCILNKIYKVVHEQKLLAENTD
jgi:hypothetical protein